MIALTHLLGCSQSHSSLLSSVKWIMCFFVSVNFVFFFVSFASTKPIFLDIFFKIALKVFRIGTSVKSFFSSLADAAEIEAFCCDSRSSLQTLRMKFFISSCVCWSFVLSCSISFNCLATAAEICCSWDWALDLAEGEGLPAFFCSRRHSWSSVCWALAILLRDWETRKDLFTYICDRANRLFSYIISNLTR